MNLTLPVEKALYPTNNTFTNGRSSPCFKTISQIMDSHKVITLTSLSTNDLHNPTRGVHLGIKKSLLYLLADVLLYFQNYLQYKKGKTCRSLSTILIPKLYSLLYLLQVVITLISFCITAIDLSCYCYLHSSPRIDSHLIKILYFVKI